jgi:FHA domain
LPLILGRDRGAADVVIEDPGVSGRHARVFPENGALPPTVIPCLR